ncbi:hypothetical protein BH23CHL8_BH23CHL8_13540 [soil metagenome]
MDPFDSLLRERLARLMATAPGDPGPPPQLPASIGQRGGVGPRWGAPRARDAVAGSRRIGPATGRMGSLLGGLAAAVVLVATIGGVAWYLTDPRIAAGEVPVAGAAAEGTPIVWDSGFVRLRADSLRIVTNDKVFTANGITPTSISSDPGGRRYRTLEVIWHEHEVEMRMNIYFAADDKEWWATEVRVYDGSEPGDWIGWGGDYSTPQDDRPSQPTGDLKSRLRAFGVPEGAEILALGGDGDGYIFDVEYRDSSGKRHRITCDRSEAQAGCPSPMVDLGLFRSRRGEAWSGDLDLIGGVGRANGDGPVSGDLHIRGLRLWAFQ